MQLYGNIKIYNDSIFGALLVLLTKKLTSSVEHCHYSLFHNFYYMYIVKKIYNPKIWTLELKLFHSFSLYTAFMISHHQILFPNSYLE